MILTSRSVLLLCLHGTCAAEEDATMCLPNAPILESKAADMSDYFEMSYCTLSTDENTTDRASTENKTAEWESFSFLDMHEYFDCTEHVYSANKPLYTPAMWKQLRDLFEEQSEIDMSSSNIDLTHIQNYYSGYSDESKGRGTFAARNFTKGELVHDGAISTVFWANGDGWKEYVMALPRSMACDVLEWTWIQEMEDYGSLLCLNLNDAAFLNHDDDFNIATKSSTSLEFYAVRGEAVLIVQAQLLHGNISCICFHFRHHRRRRADV